MTTAAANGDSNPLADWPDLAADLAAWNTGDRDARERAVSAAYHHLHALAERQLPAGPERRHVSSHGLVHELFIRLCGTTAITWKGPRHFFVISARMMRRIRIDLARHRSAARRATTGPQATVPLDEATERVAAPATSYDGLGTDLHDAIGTLRVRDHRAATVAELHAAEGRTLQEVADELAVSERTARSDWARARDWLRQHLSA